MVYVHKSQTLPFMTKKKLNECARLPQGQES